MPSQELGQLNDPPAATTTSTAQSANPATSACAPNNAVNASSNANAETNASQTAAVSSSSNHEVSAPISAAPIPLATGNLINARPGSMVRVPETIANGSKF